MINKEDITKRSSVNKIKEDTNEWSPFCKITEEIFVSITKVCLKHGL